MATTNTPEIRADLKRLVNLAATLLEHAECAAETVIETDGMGEADLAEIETLAAQVIETAGRIAKQAYGRA